MLVHWCQARNLDCLGFSFFCIKKQKSFHPIVWSEPESRSILMSQLVQISCQTKHEMSLFYQMFFGISPMLFFWNQLFLLDGLSTKVSSRVVELILQVWPLIYSDVWLFHFHKCVINFTGKSLSEALVFAEHRDNMLCT